MQLNQSPEIAVEVYIMSATQKNTFVDEDAWKSWFALWLSTLKPHLPKAEAYELTLRLADDREIQDLNQQYRRQNKPTDVLAFSALEVDVPRPSDGSIASEPLYLGDIIISIDTAERQATAQKHSLSTELAWLAAHGLLHIIGWDHPDEESLVRMLAQQESLLELVGLFLQNK